MKYVVLGAGAIGGVVGGRLFQAGCDVTMIARGQNLATLRASGLRIESPAGTKVLPVPVVDSPRAVVWHSEHVVLMTVKSHQTSAALSALVEVAPPETPIVCLQNGIANEPAALRMFASVQGVSVACPASHLHPGTVQAWSTPVTGLLDIGRYPSGTDRVSEVIAADLRSATFSSQPVGDILRWKHRKLLTNLGNVVEAVCGPAERGGPLGEILVAEGEAVLATAGLQAANCRGGCAAEGWPPSPWRDQWTGASWRILVAKRAAWDGRHRDGLPQRRDRTVGQDVRGRHTC